MVLAIASLSLIGTALEFADQPFLISATPAQAAKTSNPCNPCAAKTTKSANPCNPCAAKSASPDNPCNPCAAKGKNPCAAKSASPDNPCNPRAANQDNPCNPCNPRAANKDNPCNPCNPRAANQDNPCNPCGGGSTQGVTAGEIISWGRDYRKFEKVSDFIISLDHGNRFVVSYISPKEAAKIFRHNASLNRSGKKDGFRSYPEGTVIVEESWARNPGGKPEELGPLFLMRKEKGSNQKSEDSWRYGFTRPDFSVVAEGRGGKVAYCGQCHQQARNRDYIFAR